MIEFTPDAPWAYAWRAEKTKSHGEAGHREAFQLYLKDRSIKRVADAIGTSEKVVQAWSARFHWVARAAAHDLRQDEIQAEEQDRQTRQHTASWVEEQFVQRKRNLKSGRAMQDKGDRKLNLPDTERLIKTENGATVFRPRAITPLTACLTPGVHFTHRRLPHTYPLGIVMGALPQAQYPPPHHLSAGRAFVWMVRYLDRAPTTLHTVRLDSHIPKCGRCPPCIFAGVQVEHKG